MAELSKADHLENLVFCGESVLSVLSGLRISTGQELFDRILSMTKILGVYFQEISITECENFKLIKFSEVDITRSVMLNSYFLQLYSQIAFHEANLYTLGLLLPTRILTIGSHFGRRSSIIFLEKVSNRNIKCQLKFKV